MKFAIHFAIYALTFLVLSVSLKAQTHGTAIMVIRTNTEIVVAADSQESDENNNRIGTTCKIRKFGDFYAIVNGLEADPPTGLDAFALLEIVGSSTGSIFERISRFEQSIKPKLKLALMNKKHGPGFAVTFVGFIANSPYVIGSAANVTRTTNSLNVDFERNVCPSDACKTDSKAVFVYYPRESFAKFQHDQPNYYGQDLSKIVEAFVQFNIDIKQAGVGGPIAVLQITRGKSFWIKPCIQETGNRIRK
jgi:hypothetical protein